MMERDSNAFVLQYLLKRSCHVGVGILPDPTRKISGSGRIRLLLKPDRVKKLLTRSGCDRITRTRPEPEYSIESPKKKTNYTYTADTHAAHTTATHSQSHTQNHNCESMTLNSQVSALTHKNKITRFTTHTHRPTATPQPLHSQVSTDHRAHLVATHPPTHTQATASQPRRDLLPSAHCRDLLPTSCWRDLPTSCCRDLP